jgi:hypothetical protein
MSATKTYPAEGGFLVAGRLAATFVAGFIGIAVFHQGSSWLLYKLGIYPVAQYKMQPLPPFGVPQVVSQCFWGGLWALVLAWTLAHWRSVNYWLLAFAFGLILPPLVGWFVVPLIKGTPIMGGPPWMIQVIRPFPIAIWAVGTAWLLTLLPPKLAWRR